MPTHPGKPVNKFKKNISQLRNKLCPEGVWGPILRNTNVKNVWDLRPHGFFTLLLRKLGPRPPPPQKYIEKFEHVVCFPSYLGMDINSPRGGGRATAKSSGNTIAPRVPGIPVARVYPAPKSLQMASQPVFQGTVWADPGRKANVAGPRAGPKRPGPSARTGSWSVHTKFTVQIGPNRNRIIENQGT